MRSFALISTRIILALGCAGCARSAPRAAPAPVAPASASPERVGTLSLVERRVLDRTSGKPTDTAQTIDEYVAHLKSVKQRPSGSYDDPTDDPSLSFEVDAKNVLVIKRGKTVLHRRPFPADRQRIHPEQLLAWKDHWILEIDDDVVVDGESLKRARYSGVFDWMIVDGEPLFFFVKDGKVGINHRGQELPIAYDDVLHGACCEPGAFNPLRTSWGVRFHARRGVNWYYVELGVP